MDDFERWAAGAYDYAGVDVDEEELGLVHLLYDVGERQLRALDHLDLARFPSEPIDPRVAPDNS